VGWGTTTTLDASQLIVSLDVFPTCSLT
jgi:hypothetical protein